MESELSGLFDLKDLASESARGVIIKILSSSDISTGIALVTHFLVTYSFQGIEDFVPEFFLRVSK